MMMMLIISKFGKFFKSYRQIQETCVFLSINLGTNSNASQKIMKENCLFKITKIVAH